MAGCSGCREGRTLPFEISVAFQPIVDLESGAPYAYEALVRGSQGESAGWVLDQVSEDNRYTFDQACRVAAIEGAVAAGILETDARLSINFLPNAVYSPMACIQLTLATARATGLPPERLIFEFTEHEQVDPQHVIGILEAYRTLGFTTAIDDFGAGHSGLGLLAEFQPDLIKLDMELIRGIDVSPPRRMIVDATVRLCADMGLTVIAEGIETEGELAALRDLGVRYVQGFHLARPGWRELPALCQDALRAAA